MADNSTEIAAIDARQNAGATRINTDGLSVQIDPDQDRKKKRDLKLEDAATIAAGNARPAAYRMKMNNCF